MHFKFLTTDVWDGLVLGTVLIGLSLAILRILSDRAIYKRQQSRTKKENAHLDD